MGRVYRFFQCTSFAGGVRTNVPVQSALEKSSLLKRSYSGLSSEGCVVLSQHLAHNVPGSIDVTLTVLGTLPAASQEIIQISTHMRVCVAIPSDLVAAMVCEAASVVVRD